MRLVDLDTKVTTWRYNFEKEEYIAVQTTVGEMIDLNTHEGLSIPIIEIPELHGRLIDADALVEDLKRQCEEVFKIDAVSPDDFWITRDQAYNERLWKTWCESFFEYLKTRETIIPESEDG